MAGAPLSLLSFLFGIFCFDFSKLWTVMSSSPEDGEALPSCATAEELETSTVSLLDTLNFSGAAKPSPNAVQQSCQSTEGPSSHAAPNPSPHSRPKASTTPFTLPCIHVRASVIDNLQRRYQRSYPTDQGGSAFTRWTRESRPPPPNDAASSSPRIATTAAAATNTALPSPAVEQLFQLPSDAFDMPLQLRCHFCQLHDSTCGRCHHQWQRLKRQRRVEIANGCYKEALNQERRLLLLLLTAAVGTGPFVEMQYASDGPPLLYAVTDVRVEAIRQLLRLSPSVSGKEEKMKFLDSLNLPESVQWRVTHFACFFENRAVLQALWSSDVMGCSDGALIDPHGLNALQLLSRPPSSLAMRSFLNECPLLRQYILWRYIAQHLRSSAASTASTAVELLSLELRQRNPMLGLWATALVAFVKGRFGECQQLCEELRRDSTTAVSEDTSVARSLSPTAEPSYVAALYQLAVDQQQQQDQAQREKEKAASALDCLAVDSAATTNAALRLRRFSFQLVRRIFSFVGPSTLLATYHCSAMPLLRSSVVEALQCLPPRLATSLLTENIGYQPLLERIVAGIPPSGVPSADYSASHLLLPTHATVTRVISPSALLIRVFVLCGYPGNTESGERLAVKRVSDTATSAWGQVQGEPETNDNDEETSGRASMATSSLARHSNCVILSAPFQLASPQPSETLANSSVSTWEAKSASSWTVDAVATRRWRQYIQNEEDKQPR